jgi:hypothetical protein
MARIVKRRRGVIVKRVVSLGVMAGVTVGDGVSLVSAC